MEEKSVPMEFPKRETQTITIERSLSVEATAVEDQQGNWSDLQVLEDKAEYFRMLEEIVDASKQE